MKNDGLPKICACCRKLKLPHLGRFVKKKGREHDRSWICTSCLSKTRSHVNGSPLEKEAAKAVSDTGYQFQQEYEIQPYRYDLAVPALRLLIEVDSAKWHSHPSRKARDRKKTALADKEGWALARVSSKNSDSIGILVRQAVLRREAELTLDQDH